MINQVLRAANNQLDADEAKVAAHVLNTDLLAMQKLAGRTGYTPDDVMRLNRIMDEYAALMQSTDVKAETATATSSLSKYSTLTTKA